ncbi:LOW QUALITY PROTEIN: ribonuclease pH related [Schistosoma mansoni]|uniref:ribonuclease pH related n=1 Tax=Schistosoma mansoni TaxID=6183 RepID=UPI00022C84A1|nr:LOW QUALITY PROTEIN: ribonuclease pH related [Schistosoma mansoni]|eukprot:XP_018647296.1 LOW QUALITY PROTEIN: ribonuclease pH related [Schistosoma mansoni]
MTNSTSLFIETNTDCNAIGSATWDFAGHHVVFSIYGPDEAKINDELTHRAYVDVTVTPRTGQRTSKESELEIYLNHLMERLIDVKEFPRSKFTGRLFIVTGGTNHPRTVAAAINAISLALLHLVYHYEQQLHQYVIQSKMLVFAVDVTHPKLYTKKHSSNEPSIFAIYTGQTYSEIDKINGSSLHIPIQNFLDIIKLPKSHDDDINSTEHTKNESIYEQALNLLDAMVSQIVSTVHI